MTRGAVRFHIGAAPAHAGLGDMAGTGTAWIDWPAWPSGPDAEVAVPVRRAIARALAELGTVTFLIGTPHPMMTIGDVPRSGLDRLFGRRLRQGATRDCDAVERLFDDPVQSWWLGSAVALISAPGSPPPTPDLATWQALAGDGWIAAAQGVGAIDGALRSGVDGQFAGWWSRDPALRDDFARALSG